MFALRDLDLDAKFALPKRLPGLRDARMVSVVAYLMFKLGKAGSRCDARFRQQALCCGFVGFHFRS